MEQPSSGVNETLWLGLAVLTRCVKSGSKTLRCKMGSMKGPTTDSCSYRGGSGDNGLCNPVEETQANLAPYPIISF